MIRVTAILALTLLCTGCDKKMTNEKRGEIIPAAPIELTKAEEGINNATNSFGLELFRKINVTEGTKSMFISPLSLSLALAMTATGADGETCTQMLETLGFDGYSQEDMGRYFRKMSTTLPSVDPGTTFETANAIWVDKGIHLKSSYVNNVREWFSSEASSVDMSSTATIDKINKWCSEHTSGKIDKILDKNDTGIAMFLANALYFKGSWEQKFDRTDNGKFTCIDGKKRDAKMMSMTHRLRYSSCKGWKMVELPYGNGAFGMDVLMPDGEFGKSVGSLDAKTWDALTSDLFYNEVHVEMPSFKLEYEITLNEVLKALGIKDAFSGSADFSKMSDSPMCIDFVKQKTFVEVNEKGTEAAAVTGIAMKLTSAGPTETIQFIADRPFVYVIRELSTGSVVFIGQKVD